MPTYYINADTGNNGNPGSSASPWLTLAYAVTNSASGDTIICQDSAAVFSLSSDLTIGKNLTIQGEQDDASGAVFDGSLNTSASNVIEPSVAGVTVSFANITWQNFNPGSRMFRVRNINITLNISNCIFSPTCTIGSATFNGLLAFEGTATNTSISFDKCLFNDIHGRSGAVANAIVFVNAQTSISVSFTKCTIYCGTSGATQLSQLFFANQSMATSTLIVKNTIIHSGRGTNIAWGTVNINTQSLSYSCFSNVSSVPTASNSITSDPLFADAASSDFRLQRDSPAIATGVLV